MSEAASPASPSAPGRFRGLGTISERMAIIQSFPIHVNGAYREGKGKIGRVRI